MGASCTGCGVTVDANAKACPACGRPRPALSAGMRVAAPLVAIALVVLGFKACFVAFGNG
jgi:hypothetical protein